MDASELRKIEEHFDGIAKAYYGIVDSTWYEFGYFHQKELAFLRSSISNGHRLAVDAGCGPGRHTLAIAAVSRKVIALDISRGMLKAARETVSEFRPRVELVQADVRRMPIRTGLADLVVNFEVLEHLPGRGEGVAAALGELRRILRPTGALITEAPLLYHTYMDLVSPPSLKELATESLKSYYERAPLLIEEFQNERDIESKLRGLGLVVSKKAHVRVLPSGLVERCPRLAKVDAILERIPGIKRLAREVIWLAEVSPSGTGL